MEYSTTVHCSTAVDSNYVVDCHGLQYCSTEVLCIAKLQWPVVLKLTYKIPLTAVLRWNDALQLTQVNCSNRLQCKNVLSKCRLYSLFMSLYVCWSSSSCSGVELAIAPV